MIDYRTGVPAVPEYPSTAGIRPYRPYAAPPTECDLGTFPTGDHNPSRDHSPKLFVPTYDRSL
eukprot:SAG31_NODE_716_length_12626_cov_7.493973_1_plen_62_part_10